MHFIKKTNYEDINMEQIGRLCALSINIKCRYPNYLNKLEKINFNSINDLSSSYSLLLNTDFLCDCTSVTWLLIINYYFRLKELKPRIKENLEINIIKKLPDMNFHLYFPRNYQNNNLGTIYYLEYTPFHLLMEYFKSDLIPLKTNNMGWWCICVGSLNDLKKVYNYEDIISKLIINDGEVNEYAPLYLCFWGVREGTDCSISIVTYNKLYSRLVKDAKLDWQNYLENSSETVMNTSQGLFECILKKNNIDMDSVKFINLGSLFKPNYNSNLDLSNFYENRANNLINGY